MMVSACAALSVAVCVGASCAGAVFGCETSATCTDLSVFCACSVDVFVEVIRAGALLAGTPSLRISTKARACDTSVLANLSVKVLPAEATRSSSISLGFS